MVKSVCGYSIFYQIDNNLLPSMEQHQEKLMLVVAQPKGQCYGPSVRAPCPNTDINK